jgi:hypothetical protein
MQDIGGMKTIMLIVVAVASLSGAALQIKNTQKSFAFGVPDRPKMTLRA